MKERSNKVLEELWNRKRRERGDLSLGSHGSFFPIASAWIDEFVRRKRLDPSVGQNAKKWIATRDVRYLAVIDADFEHGLAGCRTGERLIDLRDRRRPDPTNLRAQISTVYAALRTKYRRRTAAATAAHLGLESNSWDSAKHHVRDVVEPRRRAKEENRRRERDGKTRIGLMDLLHRLDHKFPLNNPDTLAFRECSAANLAFVKSILSLPENGAEGPT